MGMSIKIGQKEFRLKKDAIAHYKTILNSYKFGQSLNDSDFDDIIDLLNYRYANYLVDVEDAEQDNEDVMDSDTVVDKSEETKEIPAKIGQLSLPFVTDNDKDKEEEGEGLLIIDIKIAKAQFNTKCFELFYNDGTSSYMSYLMILNNTRYTPEKLFSIACRNAIHSDIMAVKQTYFDENSVKGQVKCQETGILSKWTELVVDHRQPNTFSIIVDRFKEINQIKLDAISYDSNEQNHIVFRSSKLLNAFKKYHKEKANLRIIRKERNASRTGMARVKRSTKDLIIK